MLIIFSGKKKGVTGAYHFSEGKKKRVTGAYHFRMKKKGSLGRGSLVLITSRKKRGSLGSLGAYHLKIRTGDPLLSFEFQNKDG